MVHQFESFDAVCLENRRRRIALRGRPAVAPLLKRITKCRCHSRCRQVFCAKCSRIERKAAYRLARELAGWEKRNVVTILLRQQPAGKLKGYSVATARGSLTKLLRRCGFRKVIGAIDAHWNFAKKAWFIHAHLLPLRLSETAMENLREKSERWEIPNTLFVQPVRNRERQLSYLEKHFTYYRVGGRAVPLRGDLLEELALWKAGAPFSGHRISIGVRRIYGHRTIGVRRQA